MAGCDDEGCYEDFLRDINDAAGIRSCYAQHGAVGVTGVLTQAECRATIAEVQGIVRAEVGDDAFAFDDRATHAAADRRMNAFGVVGKAPLFHPVLTRNRFHANVVKAYSIAYDLRAEDLLVQYDRVAWMRPTVSDAEGELRQYRMTPNVHLDICPQSYFEPALEKSVRGFLAGLQYSGTEDLLKENNAKCAAMGRQLQGVLSLIDNDEEDGGFCFVPGGHRALPEWYARFKGTLGAPSPNGRHIFRPTDREFKAAVRLPCPAGTLILFDASLPHGTKPNFSDKHRMIQFLRYMPRSTLAPAQLEARKALIQRELRRVGVALTPEQRKLI